MSDGVPIRSTIGNRLDAHQGRGPGFDFLRLALAFTILCLHAPEMVHGGTDLAPWTPLAFVFPLPVPAFFALSGFLVMGSAARVGSIATFIKFRTLRIAPALFVDVILCAIVLGTIFTTLPLREYLSSPGFFSYFLNVFGNIHYNLPGVFEINPNKAVNGSLWTIQPELLCYMFFVLLMMRRGHLRPALLGCLFVCFSALAVYLDYLLPPKGVLDQTHTFAVSQFRLFTYFVCGGLMYQLRYRIPLSLPIFLASAVISPVLLQVSGLRVLATPLVVYMVIYVGLRRIRIPAFLRGGDYSYGMYLYHFPILQTAVTIFPSISIFNLIILSTPLVIGFAWLSWNLVEKPALRLKDRPLPARRVSSRSSNVPERFALAVAICGYIFAVLVWSDVFSMTGMPIRENWLMIVSVILLTSAVVSLPTRERAPYQMSTRLVTVRIPTILKNPDRT